MPISWGMTILLVELTFRSLAILYVLLVSYASFILHAVCLFALQANVHQGDVREQLQNVFATHGAQACEPSVLAPKPSAVSALGVLELRRLHAPLVKYVGGLDISGSAAEISHLALRDMESCLAASSGSASSLSASTGMNYARWEVCTFLRP
jgi:hypothetical protein